MTIKYNPQEVTDWLTPLEKVYARQSRQLDRYHGQLRERDQQEREATIDLPEVFSKLANFSSSIKNLKTSRENKKAQLTEKTNAEISYNRSLANIDDKRVNEAVEHLKDSQYLKKDLNKYTEQVQGLVTSGKIQQHEANYLISLHGGKFLKEQEYIGHQLTKQMLSKFQESLKEAKVQTEWDSNENNPDARIRQIQRFAIGEYSKVGLKESFVLDNFWGSIERQLDTKGVLEKIKYNQVNLAQKEVEIDNEIDVALGKLDIDSSALTFQAQLHIQAGVNKGKGITVEDSKNSYTNRLYRLGKQGGLQQHELDLLKKGQLPIPHAAGKTGEILLKPEQWQRIQQGINEYNANYIAAHSAHNIQNLNDFFANYIQGNETEQAKALALKTFESNGGDTNSKLYKSLSNANPFANTAESYQNENQYWEQAAIDGKLLSKENLALAKEIGNNALSTEIETQQKALQKSYNNNGFDSYEKRHKANGNLIMKMAKNRTLGDNEVLEGFNERLQDEITNLEGKLYSIFYNENPNDLQIADKVAIEKKRILAEKGFYAQPGDENEGVYTKDAGGNFTNYKNSIIGQVETFNKADNIRNRNNWSNQISRSWNSAKYNLSPGDTIKEKVLNTVNAVLSPEDIIGAFENNKISEELIYKASLFPNTNETELLIAATQALIASDEKEHQTIVKAFKLEDKLKKLPTAQLDLKKQVEALQDKDLSFILDQGLNKITPKQLLRLYTKLQIIADESNEETAAMRLN